MTLNVNLEDVPWEILEAVRLRILAERRAMEQSRLQRRPIALRPQAQFAKLGARTDQRRLPEPAAILETFQKFDGIFQLLDNFVDTSVWGHEVTTFGSVEVFEPSPDPELDELKFVKQGRRSFKFSGSQNQGGIFVNQSIAPAIGLGDFTFQAWVLNNSSNKELSPGQDDWVVILSSPDSDPGPTIVLLEGQPMFWIFAGVPEQYRGVGSVQIPEQWLIHQDTIGSDRWYHLAVMRKNGKVRIFVDGVPSTETFDYPELDSSGFGDFPEEGYLGASIPLGPWLIGDYIFSYLNNNTFSFDGYLDKVELFGRLIYDFDGFTPPS